MTWLRAKRRPTTIEVRPLLPGDDLIGVSVAQVDRIEIARAFAEGRASGGYIARNPANPADAWYVARAYFEEHYELERETSS